MKQSLNLSIKDSNQLLTVSTSKALFNLHLNIRSSRENLSAFTIPRRLNFKTHYTKIRRNGILRVQLIFYLKQQRKGDARFNRINTLVKFLTRAFYFMDIIYLRPKAEKTLQKENMLCKMCLVSLSKNVFFLPKGTKDKIKVNVYKYLTFISRVVSM